MWYTVDTRDNKLYCIELQQQRKYWNHMDCVWHCRHKKFFLLSVGTFPPYSSIQLSLSSPVLSSPPIFSLYSLHILSSNLSSFPLFSSITSWCQIFPLFLSFLPSHHDIESFLFSSLFFHHIMMSNLSSFPLFSSITSWCQIFPLFLSFLPSHHDVESFLFSSLFFHHIMMSNLSSFPLFSSITSWCRIFPRWWRPFCRSAEVHERVRFRSSQRLEKLSTTHFQIMIRKCDKLR